MIRSSSSHSAFVFFAKIFCAVALLVGSLGVLDSMTFWSLTFDKSDLGIGCNYFQGLSQNGTDSMTVWVGNSRLKKGVDFTAVQASSSRTHVFLHHPGMSWTQARPLLEWIGQHPGVEEVFLEVHAMNDREINMTGSRLMAHSHLCFASPWRDQIDLFDWDLLTSRGQMEVFLGQKVSRAIHFNHEIEWEWEAFTQNLHNLREVEADCLETFYLPPEQPKNHHRPMDHNLSTKVLSFSQKEVESLGWNSRLNPEVEMEFKRTVKTLHEQGVKVTLVSVPEWSGVARHMAWRKDIEEIAIELGLEYIDGYLAGNIIQESTFFQNNIKNQHLTQAGQAAYTCWLIDRLASSEPSEPSTPFLVSFVYPKGPTVTKGVGGD